MSVFQLPCVSCNNQLFECGSLLNSPSLGPLVACEICRVLYFIEIRQNGGKTDVILQPTNMDPVDEYEIIRWAEIRTPLKEYLPILEKETPSLLEIVSSAKTPSDLIRKLNGENS